jgi:hypothetical protein
MFKKNHEIKVSDNIGYRLGKSRQYEKWYVVYKICQFLQMSPTRAIDFVLMEFYKSILDKEREENQNE